MELAEKSVQKVEPEPDEADGERGADEAEAPAVPTIIVSTKPAELIQANGEPEYAPIDGTDLLYMSNSESDVLMHIGMQDYFVLIAGVSYALNTDKSVLLIDGKYYCCDQAIWFVADAATGPWVLLSPSGHTGLWRPLQPLHRLGILGRGEQWGPGGKRPAPEQRLCGQERNSVSPERQGMAAT